MNGSENGTEFVWPPEGTVRRQTGSGRAGGRRRAIIGIVIAAIVILFAWAASLAEFITDYSWYADLGHTNVFWVTTLSPWVVGGIFAIVFFALAYVNIRLARGFAPRVRPVGPGAGDPAWMQAIGQAREIITGAWVDWALIGLAIVLAVLAGASISADWALFQQAIHATPFHVLDPQFHMDVSFFVFQMPALRSTIDWLAGSIVVVLIVTAGVHVLDGAIRPWQRGSVFAPHVKAHLSVLAGLWFVVRAADYLLRTFELDLSPRGQVLGASYADVHAELPALYILIAVALIVAVALIANIRFRGWRIPVWAIGAWVAAAVLIGTGYPALIQAFWVTPNEVSLEAPYIARNIEFTRSAFGLDKVMSRPFTAATDLTAAGVVANRDTLDNVRLWGPSVVQQTYKQLQELRPYYDFHDVDIDRYAFGSTVATSGGSAASGSPATSTVSLATAGAGPPQQEVLISAREMNTAQLTARAQTWVNEHLVYTHGYGLVMSPVNQSTSQGLPQFIVSNLPPRSTEISITSPGIYFGEEEGDYVIADTNLKEFDYPQGADNAVTTYVGKTGVPMGDLLGRVLFAIRFGSTDVLFSSYLKPTSRVLFHRQLTDRLNMLAPWLALDGDPYLAVVSGRPTWIVDGYTTSAFYPYSQPAAGKDYNYIRNSVKVTIDAYDGTTKLYAFDPTDPVLATWGKVFPGLLTDVREMPAEVRAHLRYPEDLFSVQANVYTTYHMTDPVVFYNKEDQWSLANQAKGTPMTPFYVLMRLPGETHESFLLMVPFTPVGRANMIGWMAAKSDPSDYGQRVVYTFPKQSFTSGPEQISARINQDPTISPQLTLWNQRGSSVIFGNMLVIPIKDSIVYIQPLYLQAEQTAIPELTRVIVAYSDKVAMEADLATALTKVFGAQAAVAVPPGTGAGATSSTTATTAPSPAGATTPSAGGDAAAARDLFQRAVAAQRKGDWAEYGRLLQQLSRVLDRMVASPSRGATAAP